LLTGCSNAAKPSNQAAIQNSGSVWFSGQMDSSTWWMKNSGNPDPFANFNVKEPEIKKETVPEKKFTEETCYQIAQTQQKLWSYSESTFKDCLLRVAIESKDFHFCIEKGPPDEYFLSDCFDVTIVQAIKKNIEKNGSSYPEKFCNDIVKQIWTPVTLAWVENERKVSWNFRKDCYFAYAALSNNTGMCSPEASTVSTMITFNGQSDYNWFVDSCRKSYTQYKSGGSHDLYMISEYNKVSPVSYFEKRLKEVMEELKTYENRNKKYDNLLK
jgi:hypothetical protein